MRKIYSFVFAAVALFSAASCQDEISSNDIPEVNGEPFAVTAVCDVQTKTALAEDGLHTNWTAGDAIAVFDASGAGVKFTTSITAEAAQAVFAASAFDAPQSLVALYPYQANLTLSEGVVSGLELTAGQTAKVDDFDKASAFTFAKSEDKDAMIFNNLYSLLKFTVKETGITEVKVSATSGSLAGKVTLDVQNGALSVVENQGVSEVTLTGEFAKNGVYYICVLPGEYEGFSISLDDYVVKTKVSKATLEANKVYDLGEVEYPLSVWGVKGNFEGGNGWANLLQLKSDGSNWFFVKGLKFTGTPEFKFNKSDNTDWWVGAKDDNSLALNKTHYLGDKNIKLASSGTYNVYFSTGLGKVYIHGEK